MAERLCIKITTWPSIITETKAGRKGGGDEIPI